MNRTQKLATINHVLEAKMRRFVLLAAATFAVVLIPISQARQHPRTSLSVSSLKVGYGHTVTLRGRLSDHREGISVSILARPFNRAGMGRLATVSTGPGGWWHELVKPSIATTYAASVSGLMSRTLMVGVKPALSIRVLGSGKVRAHAAAGTSFTRRFVQLQRRMPSGGWLTIAKQPLNRHSTTIFPASVLPSGGLRLRLAMSVNQAGSGYLGSVSPLLAIPARSVSLSMSTFKVVYGKSLDLSGRLSVAKPGLAVGIFARPFMQAESQHVATVRTQSGGHWSYRITPPFSTSYQARWGNATSRILTIGVRPAMLVRMLSGDRVWAHVSLARRVTGRSVEVQRRMAPGVWKTVAKLPLDIRASAIFTPSMLPAGTSTLRTAISVNQVGAGFLGGFGKPFLYHR
jgi:hypothetical protein